MNGAVGNRFTENNMDYELLKELKDNGFPEWERKPGDRISAKETKSGPILEELIEACGDNFLHLTRCTLPEGEWSADGAVEDLEVTYGSTPREAVARLWLAIKKD